MSLSGSMGSSMQAESLVTKSHEELDTHVDMTAMIDLVFMLNIFFMVTSLATAMAELDLPFANRATAADMENSTLISIVAKEKGERALVYIGEAGKSDPLPDDQIEERVTAAVQQGMAAGKKTVIVKAEQNVPLGMSGQRVGIAVGNAGEGIQLCYAVMEKDT